MINYKYSINEEIARWTTEVYIKNNPSLGWWIAFTNPTAGPWKKIISLDDSGKAVEIYRFARTEERPDLILVNDSLKLILLVEAKDYCNKLTTKIQMTKSLRVINDISKILKGHEGDTWTERKNYKIIPSFLWMCEAEKDILLENAHVNDSFISCNALGIIADILNIEIYKDIDNNLVNAFIYGGKRYSSLNFPFLSNQK